METSTRTVQLPLEKSDKCFQCQEKPSDATPLRLCAYCAEVLYCSEKCQKEDWSSHKLTCGRNKTDRINMKQFYPFLACLAEAARFNPLKPFHRALQYKIINSPNPGANPARFPDGSAANLIILGERVSLTDAIGWWPSATSSSVRSKMFRRIKSEGYLLPILISICVGLLREMYTTTPDGPARRRVRLRHNKSPIADFGIVRGKVRVVNQDKLAYFYLEDNTFELGQDPDEHYWLYFKTLAGQKITLDLGMFTFNLCHYLNGPPYFDNIHTVPIPPMSVPAYYADPEMTRVAPNVIIPEKEFSVLRNEAFQKAISTTTVDWDVIFRFMGLVSGKKCTTIEQSLVKDVSMDCCRALARIIQNRVWQQWPEEPLVGIEVDTGERGSELPDEEWFKYMEKWNRKFNRGKVSGEGLRKAYDAFHARQASQALA